jgi:hypothetical protein
VALEVLLFGFGVVVDKQMQTEALHRDIGQFGYLLGLQVPEVQVFQEHSINDLKLWLTCDFASQELLRFEQLLFVCFQTINCSFFITDGFCEQDGLWILVIAVIPGVIHLLLDLTSNQKIVCLQAAVVHQKTKLRCYFWRFLFILACSSPRLRTF